MQPARIIYNTSAVPAWCRRRRSCRSGASSCGAGNTWSACIPSSRLMITTRPSLRLFPPDPRHVLRLHWQLSCLICDSVSTRFTTTTVADSVLVSTRSAFLACSAASASLQLFRTVTREGLQLRECSLQSCRHAGAEHVLYMQRNSIPPQTARSSAPA